MKRYLGILKLKTKTFSGVNIRFLVRFSNSKRILRKWEKDYPNSTMIILDNNEALNCFFSDFNGCVNVTVEEYEEFMKQQDDLK